MYNQNRPKMAPTTTTVSEATPILQNTTTADQLLAAQQDERDLDSTEASTNASEASFNLVNCGETWNVQTIVVENGTERYMFYPQRNHTLEQSCFLVLEGPPNTVIRLRITECQSVHLVIRTSFNVTDLKTISIECPQSERTLAVYSLTSSAILALLLRGANEAYNGLPALSLYFSAVDQSERPGLELISLSSSDGYIQTPGWDRSTNYPPYIISCVTVTAPKDNVIFITFLSLKLGTGDFLSIAPEQCVSRQGYFMFIRSHHSKSRMVQMYRERSIPRAHIFPDDFMDEKPKRIIPLYFNFVTDYHGEWTGFRLKYSFHFKDAKPRQIGGLNSEHETKWNCSASSWPGLLEHFPCDLVPQCSESEDEALCPYTTDKCGANKVEIGRRCYIFRPQKPQSWFTSESECRQIGGIMISLETDKKWDDVLKVLELGGSQKRMIWSGLKKRQKMKEAHLNALYANTWLWLSGSVAYYLHLKPLQSESHCGRLDNLLPGPYRVSSWDCHYEMATALFCELPLSFEEQDVSQSVTLPVPSVTSVSRVPLIMCPLQHMVHKAMTCDLDSQCRKLDSSGEWYTTHCDMESGQPQPYFYCGAPGQYVPYTLVCDYWEDCTGGGDERFCIHPPCKGHMVNCGQRQCVDPEKRCDGHQDCLTNADEENCPEILLAYHHVQPPAVVNFDRPGGFTVTPLPENVTQCPETHFLCSDGVYCLPIYVRCNGIIDCPGHEDEMRCNSNRCPGFYRCRGKDRNICVHVYHLCDGRPQCPQHDDERMCDITCPHQCTCYGLAFTCKSTFHVSSFPRLHYLEARGSGLHQNNITRNIMLIHLGVQACGWSSLTEFKLYNLHSLDLSDNVLRHINFSHFMRMQQLRTLNLAHNPISVSLSTDQTKYLLPSLMVLNASGIRLHSLNMSVLSAVLSELQVLDLSHGGELLLQGQPAFQMLRVLDLTGTSVFKFSPNFMKNMDSLERVFAKSFKLCCPIVLPDVFRGDCSAPVDEISSCDDLLKSNFHRFALAVFCVLSIVGNFSSFVYRLCSSPRKIRTGFALFVIHLCVADFLMGFYLALIGFADWVYAGDYIWKEAIWKTSAMCHLAGFLSLLSSEVSAFIICLITLDRFIVIHFPFSQLRFRGTSARVACMIVWLLGVILASVPLLPALSHWDFYKQTGMCIPLPITRADFPGHSYSFSVMIVCNFVLFVLIAVGQCMIYWSVRANTMSEQKAKNTDIDSAKTKETVIATRLLYIALSDFLCWFPIGLSGLLAGVDIVISDNVNVALAIFVVPLNSALNPFIYTLNVMLEKRQRERDLRFQKFIQAHVSKLLKGPMTN